MLYGIFWHRSGEVTWVTSTIILPKMGLKCVSEAWHVWHVTQPGMVHDTFLFCSFSWRITLINSEVCVGSREASSIIQHRQAMRIEESISGNISLGTLEWKACLDNDDEVHKCMSAFTVPLQSQKPSTSLMRAWCRWCRQDNGPMHDLPK